MSILQKKKLFSFCISLIFSYFEPTARKFSDLKVQSVASQWLHLGKTQIYLVFRSVCTTFATV